MEDFSMLTTAEILKKPMILVTGFLDYLTAACDSQETFSKLPNLISYKGVTYGKTGWSSDNLEAYYKTWIVNSYAEKL